MLLVLAYGVVLLISVSLSGVAARTVLSTALLFLLAGALLGGTGRQVHLLVPAKQFAHRAEGMHALDPAGEFRIGGFGGYGVIPNRTALRWPVRCGRGKIACDLSAVPGACPQWTLRLPPPSRLPRGSGRSMCCAAVARWRSFSATGTSGRILRRRPDSSTECG